MWLNLLFSQKNRENSKVKQQISRPHFSFSLIQLIFSPHIHLIWEHTICCFSYYKSSFYPNQFLMHKVSELPCARARAHTRAQTSTDSKRRNLRSIGEKNINVDRKLRIQCRQMLFHIWCQGSDIFHVHNGFLRFSNNQTKIQIAVFLSIYRLVSFNITTCAVSHFPSSFFLWFLQTLHHFSLLLIHFPLFLLDICIIFYSVFYFRATFTVFVVVS